jgi:molybdopterin converting factor small subunit
MVTVRYWASARQAAGVVEESIQAGTLAELRAALADRPELGRVCAACSYLVDGSQADADATLPENAVVDVLPPFAGG